MRNLRAQALVLAISALLLGVVMAVLSADWSERTTARTLEERTREVLALQKETIFGLLDKYRLMTALVARRPDTVAMFENYRGRQQELKSFSARLAAMSGAARVRMVLPGGKLLAQSTLGADFNQPLEEELRVPAMQDRLGRATIFDDNGRNTYAFSASVRNQDRIVGIVAVDVDLQVLENGWALSGDLIFVTDAAGRFIAGNQLAAHLAASAVKPYAAAPSIVPAGLGQDKASYLALGERFELIGWTLNVLTDYRPALAARSSAIAMTFLITLVVATVLFILLQRRHAILAQLAGEQSAASLLEKRVADRTQALSEANKNLRLEYDERVAAETALKEAQASLIQSAKLAAIGQMSTALAHEYNQPLAAIRSYADNARTFLAKSDTSAADANLKRIARMTERMAELSRTLKSFARKPRVKLQPVNILVLLKEAITLVGPQAKARRVRLHLATVAPSLSVMAGKVRLSQVIVNLLSNAVDALADADKRHVYLGAELEQNNVTIRVEDTGPGVAEQDRHNIFDAFVTTKEVGEGLGLGLSIAYNIVHDFGGEIEVGQSKRGGARFIISLPAASEKRTR